MRSLDPTAENFPVVHQAWSPEAADGATVELYRIEGGGHGWPNGRQYLPTRLIGMIPQGFDATGIVLRFVCVRSSANGSTLALEAQAESQ